ncbi:hypothetical protein HMPREF1052_0503 [Pasteurella bettyae CCUG 2042]|uniref:Uncharacterized protein n=1 Tax=Pasteurella bettyae CCUG 2042 TaxID=1095749 RepID=I3D7T3_9PAST|nr:hypothetical protein HMPREF1052_0503 [Pasteurella bettyae CCUG 2042]
MALNKRLLAKFYFYNPTLFYSSLKSRYFMQLLEHDVLNLNE